MKTKKERLPVYQTIKTEMREWIQTGIWKQGGLIPVEAALAKEFGCARATVIVPCGNWRKKESLNAAAKLEPA